MSKELGKQSRPEKEGRSWERHVGEIRFLNGMLRDCDLRKKEEKRAKLEGVEGMVE